MALFVTGAVFVTGVANWALQEHYRSTLRDRRGADKIAILRYPLLSAISPRSASVRWPVYDRYFSTIPLFLHYPFERLARLHHLPKCGGREARSGRGLGQMARKAETFPPVTMAHSGAPKTVTHITQSWC